MSPVNEADLEWDETEREATRFRRKRLADAAGGEGLGCSLYELPAGARAWPYHYHEGNAEAMYVLSGSGAVRLDGETHGVEAGDYVPFPAGRAGAHRVVNDADDPLRYLVVSTMREPDVTVYPDSGKFGVYAGSPPGGSGERSLEGYYRIGDDVGYWTGEE